MNSIETDVHAIEELIGRRAQALRDRDAAATIASQTPGYIQDPLSGPLAYTHSPAEALAYVTDAFHGMAGPIGYEVVQQSVLVSGDLGVSHSLSRITATPTGAPAIEMWFRKTLTFTKADGRWHIAHEHESVPIGADGAAATTLRP